MIEALGDPRFYIVFWIAILAFADWRWRQHLGNQRAMILHLEIVSRLLANRERTKK